MGKKSKKRTKAPRSETTAAPPSHPELAAPAEGWAVELDEAKRAIKKKGENMENLLRLCRALRMMRQWEPLKESTAEYLTSTADNDAKEEVLGYQKDALASLAAKSRVDGPNVQAWIKTVIAGEQPIDKVRFGNSMFQNLNCIQYAALCGDVRLLEKCVALGAAIDLPPLEEFQEEEGEMAPPSCTPLILACVSLAQTGGVAGHNVPPELKNNQQYRSVLQQNLECAIQLVRLGADCQKKLILPELYTGPTVSLWRQFGFHNKTAQELAILSGRTELVDLMKSFSEHKTWTPETIAAQCHCRCGSRLSWKDCHSYRTPIQTLAKKRQEDGGLDFRYSPVAYCTCTAGGKLHWKCCWTSPSPLYQNDQTGKLYRLATVNENQPGGKFFVDTMRTVLRRRPDAGGSLDDSIFPTDLSLEEKRAGLANFIRQFGPNLGDEEAVANGKMRDMDPEVYAGVLERIKDDYFFWRDDHWRIDKYELKTRVNEWNEALEKYCNDKGITGQEREAVMKLHEASDCAPCANVTCKKRETKLKEFKSCSQCRCVAYCSRECQKAHWKKHRPGCAP